MADAAQKQSNAYYLLTIQEAAAEARFSQSYIRKQIRDGRIERHKFGRNVRIERSEFERWMRVHRRRIVGTEIGVTSSITLSPNSDTAQLVEGTVRVSR